MALRQARILSSETDNTIKQEQNTNVNIKITPRAQVRPQTVPVNFTLPESFAHSRIRDSPEQQQPNQDLHSQTLNQDSLYQFASGKNQSEALQYAPPTNSNFQDADAFRSVTQERGITDLGNFIDSNGVRENELDSLEKKNSFLEMLVEMYENNPLKVNSYVVCESKLLMDMIKLLTGCDKVELVIDDSDVGCGCSASSAKILKIDKILVTKDGKTEELKYCYNNIYTEFIKYGISLKLVV